jgi:hypothetical protein
MLIRRTRLFMFPRLLDPGLDARSHNGVVILALFSRE